MGKEWHRKTWLVVDTNRKKQRCYWYLHPWSPQSATQKSKFTSPIYTTLHGAVTDLWGIFSVLSRLAIYPNEEMQFIAQTQMKCKREQLPLRPEKFPLLLLTAMANSYTNLAYLLSTLLCHCEPYHCHRNHRMVAFNRERQWFKWFSRKKTASFEIKIKFFFMKMEILMLWPNTLYNFHMVNHHSVKWNVRIARLVVSAETRTPVQRKEINTVSVPTENLTPILHPKVWETLSTKNTFSLSGKKEKKKRKRIRETKIKIYMKLTHLSFQMSKLKCLRWHIRQTVLMILVQTPTESLFLCLA